MAPLYMCCTKTKSLHTASLYVVCIHVCVPLTRAARLRFLLDRDVGFGIAVGNSLAPHGRTLARSRTGSHHAECTRERRKHKLLIVDISRFHCCPVIRSLSPRYGSYAPQNTNNDGDKKATAISSQIPSFPIPAHHAKGRTNTTSTQQHQQKQASSAETKRLRRRRKNNHDRRRIISTLHTLPPPSTRRRNSPCPSAAVSGEQGDDHRAIYLDFFLASCFW